MAARILETLKERVVVADGAMGTALFNKGFGEESCPELLNLTRPDVVQEIHRGYLGAGCDIVLTHSFGANRFKLQLAGEEARVRELNLAAARNARLAVGGERGVEQGLVAGDVGPTGQLAAPLGSLTTGELQDGFLEQVEALAEGGVDIIVIETMTAVEEAAAAVRAARSTGLPVSVSFSFSPGAHGCRTSMGVDAGTAARAMSDEGADIVGANCGEVSPAEMAGVLAEMRSAAELPLLAEPNAGAPRLVGGTAVYDAPPQPWVLETAGLLGAGARVIGGCCGTTAEHIALLAEHVRQS